jgi:hypothetical protein
MTVNEVIDDAVKGELKKLAVKDDTPSIVSFINLGMKELYKRFVLDTEEVIIELGRVTTDSDPYERISDTVYKMPSDMMKITAAYEEDGTEISLNKEDDPLSIMTISWNKIQVPVATPGAFISVIYVKTPARIGTKTEDLNAVLELPESLEEALLHYIGYRGHGSLDGNIQAENNTHYQRFEASVKRAESLGVLTADGPLSRDVQDKGWV